MGEMARPRWFRARPPWDLSDRVMPAKNAVLFLVFTPGMPSIFGRSAFRSPPCRAV